MVESNAIYHFLVWIFFDKFWKKTNSMYVRPQIMNESLTNNGFRWFYIYCEHFVKISFSLFLSVSLLCQYNQHNNIKRSILQMKTGKTKRKSHSWDTIRCWCFWNHKMNIERSWLFCVIRIGSVFLMKKKSRNQKKKKQLNKN